MSRVLKPWSVEGRERATAASAAAMMSLPSIFVDKGEREEGRGELKSS